MAGMGTEFLNSMTGNIETALLVIHDYREMVKKAKVGTPGAMTSAQARVAMNNDIVAGTAAALSSGTAPSFPNSQDKTFRVQFNPSELTMNASSTPVNKTDAENGRSRTLAVEDPKLYLTVNLYFDDMNTYDSFMVDKFTGGLVSVQGITNIAQMIETGTGTGKTHSVQPQVEALISALRNPYTRTISFRWADFTFIGQLNTVRANYTMFSTSGRPVRAQVLLRIQHELDPGLLNQWYSDFNKAFGGDASNMTKIEQNVGNLLNLNL